MKERWLLALSVDKVDAVQPVHDVGIALDGHMCALFSVSGSLRFKDPLQTQQRYFLCTDLGIDNSILTPSLSLPVLRELVLHPSQVSATSHYEYFFDRDFAKPIWLDIKPTVLRNLRLFLTDSKGNAPSVTGCLLECTLLIVNTSASR